MQIVSFTLLLSPSMSSGTFPVFLQLAFGEGFQWCAWGLSEEATLVVQLRCPEISSRPATEAVIEVSFVSAREIFAKCQRRSV